jgi:soluble lytic murein transglycosylase
MKKETKLPVGKLLGILAAGALVSLLGIGFYLSQGKDGEERVENIQPATANPDSLQEDLRQSQVLTLADLPPQTRFDQLQSFAETTNSSSERNRARYLLAVDLLAQNRPQEALPYLNGLAEQYPVLAPQILVQQAQAYQLNRQDSQARATWQKLADNYSQSPMVVEAWWILGRANADYWQRALTQFPHHRRSLDIWREKLKTEPNNPKLLVALAKYTPDGQEAVKTVDRLVREFSAQLTSQDWETMATVYWQQREYGKAMTIYAKAPATPKNLYRYARSSQIGKQTAAAKTIYQKLVQQFPQAPETALGLLNLAKLSTGKEAIAYLDRVIKNFRDQAPEALTAKITLLEKSGSQQSASQNRQLLLKNYANSEAAAVSPTICREGQASGGLAMGATDNRQ